MRRNYSSKYYEDNKNMWKKGQILNTKGNLLFLQD